MSIVHNVFAQSNIDSLEIIAIDIPSEFSNEKDSVRSKAKAIIAEESRNSQEVVASIYDIPNPKLKGQNHFITDMTGLLSSSDIQKIDEILNSASLQFYYKGREQKLFKDVLQLFMCGIRY